MRPKRDMTPKEHEAYIDRLRKEVEEEKKLLDEIDKLLLLVLEYGIPIFVIVWALVLGATELIAVVKRHPDSAPSITIWALSSWTLSLLYQRWKRR